MNTLLQALLATGVVIDDKMKFGLDLAFTVSAGTHAAPSACRCSTLLDFGISNVDQGAGSPLWLTVQLVTSIDTIGVSTGEEAWIEIWHGNNASAGGIAGTEIALMESAHWKLSALCPASKTPGFKWINAPLPAHHGRYLQLVVRSVGDALGAGTMDAFFHLGGMPAKRRVGA